MAEFDLPSKGELFGERRSNDRDRTMLQRMGFNDPDRRSPKHDQMSFALADPDFFASIVFDASKELLLSRQASQRIRRT